MTKQPVNASYVREVAGVLTQAREAFFMSETCKDLYTAVLDLECRLEIRSELLEKNERANAAQEKAA